MMRWSSRNRFRRPRSRALRGALLLCTAAALTGAIRGWTEEQARAEVPSSEKPAVIDFVNLGGIRNWRAQGDQALLVQSARGLWYRVTFLGSCPGLRFQEELAFVTDGTNRLDRFSSILFDRQRCWFQTFEPIETPEAGAAPEPGSF